MRTPRRRGFSLVELVISIAIIATLAGVASVRFARSAELARVESAAHRVVSIIDDARTRARTRGTSCTVQVDAVAATVRLTGAVSGAAELDLIRLGTEPYRVSVKSVSFGGNPDLKFTARGRPLEGGMLKVFSGAFERTVTVDPETGHATID